MSNAPIDPEIHRASRIETFRQFVRFGMVGSVGFVVDSGALYAVRWAFGLDLYSGRLLSWCVAATSTWAMNRRFTFADTRPPFRQWLAFLAANALGGSVNYAVYAALVTFVPRVTELPILGVAAGAFAGLAFNFTASKAVVFRRARKSAL